MAYALIAPEPPIVRLLGYFIAGPSANGVAAAGEGAEGDALWVVLKWEVRGGGGGGRGRWQP